MNKITPIHLEEKEKFKNGEVVTRYSACPHDCPSTCALEVEKISPTKIGRIRGSKENDYTDGVVCAKVARYAERVHSEQRLRYPMRRIGPKGSGQFERISWDEAIQEIVTKFNRVEEEFGSEAVWPIYYAGTMGLVQRDGINRIRYAKKYSGYYGSICTALGWSGYKAGTGSMHGIDPREMSESDVIILWGSNAVSTQVNVMTHATKARKNNGTKIIAVDVYETPTVKQADISYIVRPGTDGALACAIMHLLFKNGHADWEYLNKYADDPKGLETHLKDKTPEWAAEITGLSVGEIEAFAEIIGQNKKSFFRIGYGFTRSRNGAVNSHAVTSIPVVTGAWKYRGGGALLSNSGMYGFDASTHEGQALRDKNIRVLDQSRMSDILTNDPEALKGGGPVKAVLIQNTNPMSINPDLNRLREGFLRDDLFVAVHEQFMTDTAKYADILLPATTFLEHDDVYKGGGHSYVIYGPKIIEALDESKSNNELYQLLSKGLGIDHLEGFQDNARELVDKTLTRSFGISVDELEEKRWIDRAQSFEDAHYLSGFKTPDKKYRFKPDWVGMANNGDPEDGHQMSTLKAEDMPEFPDHWNVIENETAEKPFRLVTAPARNYLNSTFTETKTSQEKEARPTVIIEAQRAAELGIEAGEIVRVTSERGSIRIHAEIGKGLRRNTVVIESIWPNDAFIDGIGVNSLTCSDGGSPIGGAAFHDNRVSIEKIAC